jgi:hypothetical protein
VEIVGACASAETVSRNVIATAAFCVINTGWTCASGAVFPGVVLVHRPDTTVVGRPRCATAKAPATS